MISSSSSTRISESLSGASAQVQEPNRVLELDGRGAFVELPPNIFTNLTEATVEVWAKWDSFKRHSRIFEFGAVHQSMSLLSRSDSRDLRFDVSSENTSGNAEARHSIIVPELLRTGEWVHVAAVSGPGGP